MDIVYVHSNPFQFQPFQLPPHYVHSVSFLPRCLNSTFSTFFFQYHQQQQNPKLFCLENIQIFSLHHTTSPSKVYRQQVYKIRIRKNGDKSIQSNLNFIHDMYISLDFVLYIYLCWWGGTIETCPFLRRVWCYSYSRKVILHFLCCIL